MAASAAVRKYERARRQYRRIARVGSKHLRPSVLRIRELRVGADRPDPALRVERRGRFGRAGRRPGRRRLLCGRGSSALRRVEGLGAHRGSQTRLRARRSRGRRQRRLGDPRRGRLRFRSRGPSESRYAHARCRRRSARGAHKFYDGTLRVAGIGRHDHRHASRRARPLRTNGRLSGTNSPRSPAAERLCGLRAGHRSGELGRRRSRRDRHGAQRRGRTRRLSRTRRDAPLLEPEQPLRYTVGVSHVARDGERFDLLRKRTADPWFTLTVDGSRKSIDAPNPYPL